jgi:hypothetical protein
MANSHVPFPIVSDVNQIKAMLANDRLERYALIPTFPTDAGHDKHQFWMGTQLCDLGLRIDRDMVHGRAKLDLGILVLG